MSVDQDLLLNCKSERRRKGGGQGRIRSGFCPGGVSLIIIFPGGGGESAPLGA